MNLKKLKIRNITRIIAHTVIPKTSTTDAYAVHIDDVLNFRKDEEAILIKRLEESLKNSKKTFEVEFDDLSQDSIHYSLTNLVPFNEPNFIAFTKSLATKLAEAHFRTRIPGGYCLVGEGVTNNTEYFFFIIKAELQEVFAIKGIDLQTIKDVFLSPAKDFYKVAIFIKDSNNKFNPFMFDDQFSPQKKDLTDYFYSKFLGLTTDKNARLISKNFFNDTKDFIETNVTNAKDRLGLLKALTVLYREDATGIISPQDFSDKYFENDLKNKYDQVIKTMYPHSFTKDISLIENRLDLKRISIPLSYSLHIVGNSIELENVEIIKKPDSNTIDTIEPEINNGSIREIVLLREKPPTDKQ